MGFQNRHRWQRLGFNSLIVDVCSIPYSMPMKTILFCLWAGSLGFGGGSAAPTGGTTQQTKLN